MNLKYHFFTIRPIEHSNRDHATSSKKGRLNHFIMYIICLRQHVVKRSKRPLLEEVEWSQLSCPFTPKSALFRQKIRHFSHCAFEVHSNLEICNKCILVVFHLKLDISLRQRVTSSLSFDSKKVLVFHTYKIGRTLKIWKKFQIRSQNQLIFSKTLFCQKKNKLLEKIRHFEKFKNFFSWI